MFRSCVNCKAYYPQNGERIDQETRCPIVKQATDAIENKGDDNLFETICQSLAKNCSSYQPINR